MLAGSSMSLGVTSHVDEQTDSDNAAQITQSVDSQNGIDTNAVEALLKAARRILTCKAILAWSSQGDCKVMCN